MTICEKQYTVSITEPVSIPLAFLYWKMEEPSEDRIDSVQSLLWGTNPGWLGICAPADPINSIAGKVNNGTHFVQNWKICVNRLDTAKAYPSGNSLLAFDGAFNICFWIKWTAFGIEIVEEGITSFKPGDARLHWVIIDPGIGSTGFEFKFTGPAGRTSYDWIEFGSDGILPFTPVLETWYFINWFYVNATKLFGMQINNGTITMATVPIDFGSNYTKGQLEFNQSNNNGLNPFFGDPTAVAEEFIVDEFLLFKNFSRNLTTAELNFLYNGGAGRTYPFTLP